MKWKSIVGYLLLAITFVIALFSCSKNSNTLDQTNEFIQYFLDQNSVRLYKSEIQRVKVNIFPASNMLVYSFWKQESFNMNGDLYLHLYPTDKNDLVEPRRKHKFVNLPISENAFFTGPPPYFFKFENLQLPYGLASIQTGQYNKSGKTWKSVFKDYNLLNNESQAKQAMLSGKNSLYASHILKNESNEGTSPLLGPKIYQSQEDAITAVYYNANLKRFTYLFSGYEHDEWESRTLFVDIYNEGRKVKRRAVSFDEIIGIDDLKMINCDIPLNENFERLEIGQEENGIETIWKSLDKNKLIYTSFPLKSNEAASGELNNKDKEIEIVNNLILNNIPLVYFDFEKKLGLYLNEIKNRAYIISLNANDFDGLKLKSIIRKENETILENIRLQNSFFIKGENKQIVVHEIKLHEGSKRVELQLSSAKKELYIQIIEPINN